MTTDSLVIGSGLAGLALSLRLADLGFEVLLSTKTRLSETNSSMAQGGIASVLSGTDSFDSHVQDTLVAGAGLCHKEVVEEIVSKGPAMIRQLMDWGVQFDMDSESKLALTREGGHSERRIVHIADHTGQAIHDHLTKKVLEHPKIKVLENHFAMDLITHRMIHPSDLEPNHCVGAYLYDKSTKETFPVLARSTFLACGGAGKVYLYTSNWSGATGDGVAMAARAGARVANLEFTQFHPTCLYHPKARNFLISEALRGEGAELVGPNGKPFMKKYHPLGSLAPRDIVARSIDAEMKKKGLECVYLDITFKSREEIEKRLP
ncbi:FAD-binding protein, partial [bacterium]|nr:FAD-binding protein [bacterium]